MYPTFCATAAACLLALPASAANGSSGPGALALATLVSDHSQTVSHFDKRTLMKLFTGHTNVSFPAGHTITVSADKITCKTSDVDITVHSCSLIFGPRTATLTGRPAHEMFATLIENGVPSSAAAGSLYEALTQLTCTIDPNVIDQRSGGGATCTLTPAP